MRYYAPYIHWKLVHSVPNSFIYFCIKTIFHSKTSPTLTLGFEVNIRAEKNWHKHELFLIGLIALESIISVSVCEAYIQVLTPWKPFQWTILVSFIKSCLLASQTDANYEAPHKPNVCKGVLKNSNKFWWETSTERTFNLKSMLRIKIIEIFQIKSRKKANKFIIQNGPMLFALELLLNFILFICAIKMDGFMHIRRDC